MATRKPAPRAEAAKLQRWLDVLAALLRRAPGRLTFAELAEQVPQYARGLRARNGRRYQETAVTRMWERDKDELRALGVPITLHDDGEGNARAYQLESHDFFLPFVRCLTLAAAHAVGHRGPRLPTVAFSIDELAAVRRATRRVAALGDAALAAAATRAWHTLTHDLVVDGALEADDGETVVTPTLDPGVLRALGDAIANGRRVRCTYRSMHRDDERLRTLAPHGLVFQMGHWYCVATDPADGGLKTFRASRMRRVAAEGPRDAVRPPAGFSLGAHAASRYAWELGDGAQTPVRLRVSDAIADHELPGATVVARRGRRRDVVMAVRRDEPFLRWVLAFAGAVQPVSPKPVVEAYRTLARRTLAQYAEGRA